MRWTAGAWFSLAVVVAAAWPGAAGAAAGEVAVPEGYRLERHQELAVGVAHLRLVRDRGPVVVHVARLEPGAAADLRVVLSNERVGGPEPLLERTTEMCLRVSCLVAVNGDFFAPGTGEPVGGVIAGGRLLRSPTAVHHQLSVAAGGVLRASTVDWTGQLMPSDLRPLAVGGVNVARHAGQLVLYTPAHGPSTLTNPFGVEVVVRLVEPGPRLRLGQTAMVELVELREGSGDAPIPADGAVLSAHGQPAAALAELWERVQRGEVGRRALLRLEAAGNPEESLGGTPILLRDGQRWVADDGSGFVAGRHPRTVVGWDPAGVVLLVTVDGRQPGHSVGMTLPETADLMAALGATDALNLDGGGSTTFVLGGQVANRPSDRLLRQPDGPRIVHQAGPRADVVGPVERPVADALAIVPRSPVEPLVDPLVGASPALPLGPGVVAAGPDAGSVPGAGGPALVGPPDTTVPADPRMVALATVLTVTVASGAARARAVLAAARVPVPAGLRGRHGRRPHGRR